LQRNGITLHAPAFAHEGGGFKPTYFAELAKLEATNFWFRARNELILWALRKHQPLARNFLEVGCGTGFVLSGIASGQPKVDLYGSEIFVAGLSHAVERVPNAQFMQMDARRIPFIEAFDAVGAFDVLEHIEEDEEVLAQLHRALKPGGVLLLSVPQHPWLWSASDDHACHVRRYKVQELGGKVRRAGFQIERSTSFVSFLLPAMLLSRMRQTSGPETYDATTEFRISPTLNSLLLGVMRVEQYLIRLGIRLPIGGSRLIVARKPGH
jgi:SAM-dependent methyltransferase